MIKNITVITLVIKKKMLACNTSSITFSLAVF
jgi:hypothetical protein